MEALKIKIYQPHAHYRMPFTYQIRHTYPVPPYSTLKGLLCNILGISKGIEVPESNETLMKLKNLKISISAKFESKTTEYIWFRNLSKNSHNDRYGYSENRKISMTVGHPGGQIPVWIDVLNEVEVLVHLYHEDQDFLKKIKDSFENPFKRSEPLHLGRAEDWIVIEEIDFVELTISQIDGDYGRFFWIPEKPYFSENSVKFNFSKIGGLVYKLPTFYRVVNNVRTFDYIICKLNDGIITDIDSYCDSNEEEVPVFFETLGG